MSDADSTGPEGTESAGAREGQRARSEAWDRVGDYLGSMGEVGSTLVQRNLDLWKEVAADLRTSPYTAETMSVTSARLMKAAIANVEDVWSAMSQPPGARSTARVLPTAMLVFGWVDRGSSLAAPQAVSVPVPRGHSDLPKEAEISLAGSGDAAHAAAVASHLRARLSGRSYLVEGEGVAPEELEPGTYRGTVYLTNPALALADLVVVVGRKP